MSELPDPVVAPDVYDEAYYREWCGGYDEWVESDGTRFGGIYHFTLEHTGFHEGQTLVDLGCGRGELIALAARRGAARAVGVEYSPDAVKLTHHTLEVSGTKDQAEVVLADARSIPVEDGTADLVTMLDVVEHLAPAELDSALREARRLLKPGGRLFIHTMPNRYIYDVVYRWQRNLLPWRRRTWPADPRKELERVMHVNEQSQAGLRRAIADAGFADAKCDLGDWIYTDHVPNDRSKRTYHLLAKLGPLRTLSVSNLIGEGRKPA
jgi:ubiquinone/menaquinone biosynthesis C-methylase UbiE